MYAVVRTGGKQYRVAPGQQLRVDRLPGETGDTVNLNEVLLINNDDVTTVGEPTLENAHIVASIVEQGRGKKIQVFKYKNKIRYRKLRGHRQHHTDLRVEEIVGPNGASWKHEKKDPPVEDESAEAVEAELEEVDAETTAQLDSGNEADVETETEAVDDEAVNSDEDSEDEAADEAPNDNGEEEDK